MPSVNRLACAVLDHVGDFTYARPPLWHISHAARPVYVPPMIVCPTVTVPLAPAVTVAVTMYMPGRSGRSILRPATCATTLSDGSKSGTSAPSGLSSMAAVEPVG